MLAELLQDVSLFRILHQIDQDLALACQQAKCPYCDSPLHNASYARKPRGGLASIPEEYYTRLSLCCSNEKCRRRVLPPSCLFLGRKVYWKVVILIVTTLHHQNPKENSINMLARKFAINRKTVVRWISYFREVFPKSQQWQKLRGLISAQISNHKLPQTLIEYFLRIQASPSRGVIKCLEFLTFGHIP